MRIREDMGVGFSVLGVQCVVNIKILLCWAIFVSGKYHSVLSCDLVADYIGNRYIEKTLGEYEYGELF